MRIGHGYDVHAFEPGDHVTLGGVRIAHTQGVKAHSDGDVVLRALCDAHDLLLLCDEVQCGMGRTGAWFGWQKTGVRPDAFTLAKAVASGVPMGVLVASPKLADVLQPGSHASTFGGNPLACAAALATLDVIEEEGLLRRAEEAGKLLREGLQAFRDFVAERS